jgi:hypothetical protein
MRAIFLFFVIWSGVAMAHPIKNNPGGLGGLGGLSDREYRERLLMLAQRLMQPYGSEERIIHGPAVTRPNRASYSAPGLPPPTLLPQFQTDPVYSVGVDLAPTPPQQEIEVDYFKGMEDDLPRRDPPKRKAKSR